MRIATAIILVAALVTLVPALAAADENPYTMHASFISSVTPTASCEGWSTEVVVRFRWAVTDIDAAFSLAMTDEFGGVVETVTWNDRLERSADSWATQVFSYDGDWTAFAPTGDYLVTLTVTMVAPYSEGVDVGEENGDVLFHCEAVPTEAMTLSDIKGLYR